MDFKTYQKKARETAQYPDLGSNNIYPTLGLVGEAGEVAEKVKKVIRDKNGIFDNESKLGIKKELGDVLLHIVFYARKIQKFMSQPLFVATQFTGFEGRYVSLEDSVAGFKAILDGDMDEYPENIFAYKGTIDDVVDSVKK